MSHHSFDAKTVCYPVQVLMVLQSQLSIVMSKIKLFCSFLFSILIKYFHNQSALFSRFRLNYICICEFKGKFLTSFVFDWLILIQLQRYQVSVLKVVSFGQLNSEKPDEFVVAQFDRISWRVRHWRFRRISRRWRHRKGR